MDKKHIKTKFQIKTETESNVAKLYLYGNISERESWLGEDTITPKMVRESIDDIEDKDLEVHINSGGGCVFSSISIMNMLKQYKGKVTVYVDGLAGSGASVIAMSADKLVMPSNAMFMIHRASTFAYGNKSDFEKIAKDLDKIDSSVRESYKDKFVGEESELISLIDAETWLTAEECKAFGFCDEIVDEIKDEEDPEPQNNIKENLFNKYRKEPISIKSNLFNKFKTGVDD